MYMRPFNTSRMITARLPPPVLPGRISGATSPHSSSVRSLGYPNLLRSLRARFWLVPIGAPSSNQATILESQMIHMIQELFGQTLRGDLLFWGARNIDGRGFDTEQNRPTNLQIPLV